MKKGLFLLIGLLLLSGCTMDYNLVINEKTFNEEIIISENNTSNWNKICEDGGDFTYKERINLLERYPVSVYENAALDPYDPNIEVDGVEYYNKEIIDNSDTYGLKMNTSGGISNINDLNSLSYCYDIAQVINNKDEYVISTSFKNHCFEMYPLLEELNINITTDMKVTSNNADMVSGDTYTWTITRDNYDDKSISLAMQSIRDYDNDKFEAKEEEKRQEQEQKKEKQKKTVLTVLSVMGILFLIAVIAIGITIFIKNRRENKI